MSTSTKVHTEWAEVYWVACGKCDVQTRHKVLAMVLQQEHPPWDPSDTDSAREYAVAQCQGCLQISFLYNWWSMKFLGYSEEHQTELPVDHIEVYPSRLAGRKELEGAQHLPENILTVYREAHFALSNRLRILAGIGIRTLVEAVCNERSVAGKNLEKRIDNLVGKGHLTAAGAEILHGTRLLGNLAAHEAVPLDDEQLDAAMAVAENLLQNVYLLPRLASYLPKRNSPQSRDLTGATAPTDGLEDRTTGGGCNAPPATKPVTCR